MKSVTLKSGETIPCDLLVIAVGVRPCVELAEKAGCKIARGIIIDDRMMTSVTDIYASGDCMLTKDVLDEKSKIIALWPNAVQQGKAAGAAMAGADIAYAGGFAMNAIDLFGLHMLTAGIMGISVKAVFIQQ